MSRRPRTHRRPWLLAAPLLGILAAVLVFPAATNGVAVPVLALSAESAPGPALPDPIADAHADDPFPAFRAAHPEATWPHWFADNRLAWVTVGLDGGGIEGLVGTDGTLSPNGNSLGLSFWLRDDQSGVLSVPQLDQVSQSLADGDLPLITTRWTVDGATLSTTVFAASDAADPIAPGSPQGRVVLVAATLSTTGAPRPWTLYVALRPFGPAGGTSLLHNAAASASSLSANGALVLVAQTPASRYGALDETAVDASVLAKTNAVPGAPSASSRIGLAEGMLAYDLTPAASAPTTFRFAMPMLAAAPTPTRETALRRLDVDGLRQRVAASWQARLHRVQFSVGDPRVQHAFYASLAYILMARQGSEFFSGPLSERAFWFRDAAYITDALTKAGDSATVLPALRLMASSQLPSGRFPPIVTPEGLPQLPLKTEWDSQGEVIHALVEYARQTHGVAFLHAVYPRIWSATRFQEAQLAAQRVPGLAGTPFFGILPAGESAEDLYNADWHHYWDDFWAMAGFQEAADAARMLGFNNDVPWLLGDEQTLREATIASIGADKTAAGRSIITNGPEDRTTTAMARSGTPAIWPVAVLDPDSALVQDSFQTYYNADVKPYGGAYLHYNYHYWPYADVSLANAFYRLGMTQDTEQILAWVLSHQTAPNLYAWAEVVRPDTSTFALGDMPHSWMAAEMILLIRDMLVREDGQQLDIGPFPAGWLAPNGTITISDFPTALGAQSYRLTRSADGATLQLTLSGTPPPGGYALHVPDTLAAQSYRVDGGPAQTVTGDALLLPGSAHDVTIEVTTR